MTKQFQIEVVNVGAPVKVTTPRGGYNTIEVAFKQDGKVAGKKFIDIYAKDVYPILAGAKPGDNFLVKSEKDSKGYYQWLGLEQVDPSQTGNADTESGKAAASDKQASEQVSSGRPTSGRVTGNNYETPEERAVKQVVIVRQAVLNAAIEYCKNELNPETGVLEVDDVLSVARRFEEFVFDGIAKNADDYRKQVKSL